MSYRFVLLFNSANFQALFKFFYLAANTVNIVIMLTIAVVANEFPKPGINKIYSILFMGPAF